MRARLRTVGFILMKFSGRVWKAFRSLGKRIGSHKVKASRTTKFSFIDRCDVYRWFFWGLPNFSNYTVCCYLGWMYEDFLVRLMWINPFFFFLIREDTSNFVMITDGTMFMPFSMHLSNCHYVIVSSIPLYPWITKNKIQPIT